MVGTFGMGLGEVGILEKDLEVLGMKVEEGRGFHLDLG